jgi:hypothetical protein
LPPERPSGELAFLQGGGKLLSAGLSRPPACRNSTHLLSNDDKPGNALAGILKILT